MGQSAVLCGVCGLVGCGTVSNPNFQCSFATDQWNPDQWVDVKRPDWDCPLGGWIQKERYIENRIPSGATPEELISKLAPQTHASMVLKDSFEGEITISTEVEFADRMAPSIVLASTIGENAAGQPEYHNHVEVVIFDEGFNVWHHLLDGKKSIWTETARARFPLKPNTKYTLTVKLSRTLDGTKISIFTEDHELTYIDESLAETFHVGITGCEGINRFYAFSVCRNEKNLKGDDYA